MSLGSVHERPEPGFVETTRPSYFVVILFFSKIIELYELKKYQIGRNYDLFSFSFFFFDHFIARDWD